MPSRWNGETRRVDVPFSSLRSVPFRPETMVYPPMLMLVEATENWSRPSRVVATAVAVPGPFSQHHPRPWSCCCYSGYSYNSCYCYYCCCWYCSDTTTTTTTTMLVAVSVLTTMRRPSCRSFVSAVGLLLHRCFRHLVLVDADCSLYYYYGYDCFHFHCRFFHCHFHRD